MSDFLLFIDSIKSDSDEEIENKFKIEFIEMEDKDSWRPLHHACRRGLVGLVKLLLSNHCQIDSVANNGYQPIHLACKNGHIDIVKIFIENKCNINACDKNGHQPMHLACERGHTDIVKILIAKQCDINASDKWGYQPMHLACESGHIDIVKLLITNKCDINGSHYWRYQPIHLACKNGHIDIVKLLIENKCDINNQDKIDGYQPIHLAINNDHVDIVKLLIERKCDVNASDNNSCKPLYLACKKGYVDIVKILIANKSDINASDKWGYQPIHLASKKGHTDIVKILIANNCDINASNCDGYQPIHLACKNGHIDIVKILIANRCNRNATTQYGESAIDIAKKKIRGKITDILLDANPIYLITNALDLQCKIGCDHNLCRQSLENETFKKGELIRSRTFWKVYKTKTSNTNIEIVIKETKYICEDNKYIEGIINIFSSRILHRNIVRYFGALEISGILCVFMEYIPGGSLKDLIDKSKWIETGKVIKFSKQILDGLKFIHSQGIIHRDIKPDNMLLGHDESLKLTDFSLCKSMHIESYDEKTAKIESFCYSMNYLAPEVLLGEHYDCPVDIWSTGASIIHMITGKKPYHWLPPEDVMFRIASSKKIEFTACQPIAETMQSFIDDLLTPEQFERPTAKYLLEHFVFEDEK